MKSKKTMLFVVLALLALLMVAGCNRDTNTVDNEDNEYNNYQSDTNNVPTNEENNQADATDHAFGNNDDNTGARTGTIENFDGTFFFSYGLDENGYWQGISILDHVEMFNYMALTIPASVHQVSQHSIDEIIDSILSPHATFANITDREVVSGDRINIDFVGSIDGVEFAGGNTHGGGMYVTAGSTEFIGDFLFQLIGHMPGSVVYVEVPFPDDYHEESLAGLDALFVTTINHIAGAEVMPELTDDFVAENFASSMGLSTVNELLEDIGTFLQSSAVMEYIYNHVTTQVVISSIPEVVIRHHEQSLLQQHAEQAIQWGMELEDFLPIMGFDSIQDFIDASQEEIESEARFSLVMQAVAQDMGMIITSADITDFFIEHFDTNDFSMFEEIYGLPWLKQFVRNELVMDFIRNNAVMA